MAPRLHIPATGVPREEHIPFAGRQHVYVLALPPAPRPPGRDPDTLRDYLMDKGHCPACQSDLLQRVSYAAVCRRGHFIDLGPALAALNPRYRS